MIKIVMVVPFEDMKELAYQVFQEQTEVARREHSETDTYEFTAVHASTTSEVFALNLEADVIIARGGTAFDLQRSNYHIPVVEQIITGDDILTVLYQLKQQFKNQPAAVIGSPNMLLGIEDIATRVGLTVSPYYLKENTDEEIYRNVQQAIADGKQVILGGIRGCMYAHNFGVQHMLLTSGRNSIWNAVAAAKQLGRASRRDHESVLSRTAMVDNAFEGLISLDINGVITAINHAAQKILELSPGDWPIGMPLRDVVRAPRIVSLAVRADDYVDEIIEYRSTHLSFRKIALRLRGEPVGSVLTFLNASQIQETEGRLRGKLHHKGHTAKYTFSSIVGESPAIQEAIDMARAFAAASSNVMITGESGVGKELFSQSIHNASARHGQPFVAVNCAAIPENLLESELFGYVGGAFTGASKEGKAGLFEIAHNGTIFLDEISEMPLALQGRLLRVLQEREIMRLGSDKVTPIDVRIIAATNKDLREQVRLGLFREDLYYRIFVLALAIPPLRARGHDVPLLAHSFLEEFGQAEGRTPLALTADAEKLLEAQPWPGNIRELRNFCERISVLCTGDEPVGEQRLSRLLSYGGSVSTPLPNLHAETEADPTALLEALQQAGGNKTLAAQMLGISRVTLWRQLKRLEEQPGPHS